MSTLGWTPKLVQTLDELAELRFAGFHAAQYVAVLAGIRRSLDDWVPGTQFEEYRRLIARLGLSLEIDCAFVPIPHIDRVVGLEYAPTTRFAGKPFSSSVLSDPQASVHERRRGGAAAAAVRIIALHPCFRLVHRSNLRPLQVFPSSTSRSSARVPGALSDQMHRLVI
jgi:hypothetical protein